MLRLKCINIVSQAPEALAAFYEKVFDASANQLVPGRWELPAGGATLVFAAAAGRVMVPADSCGLEFETDDVDALYTRLTGQGLSPSAPVTYPWGWRAIGLKDPDGNNMDFVHNVGPSI